MSLVLRDDCFFSDADRLSHADALTQLRAALVPVTDVETTPLHTANGRILAQTVRAPRPIPAHTNAAVDGYALRHADYDTAAGTQFHIAGRAAAGRPFLAQVPTGAAVRILTGAAMPDGTETVVMQEDVQRLGEGDQGWVKVPPGLKAGANCRAAGEDVAENDVVVADGRCLRPQDLAAIASTGLADVAVYRPLRVAVVSTGDEVLPVGAAFAPGQVYDANAPMLHALAGQAGCQVTDAGILPDQPEAIRATLRALAAEHDVILTSGGASQGDEDHLSGAIAALGHRHLWQIAIKPGRPMMFGQIDDTVVVGLPGNPVAVFVCTLLYVWPMLRLLGGALWPEPLRIRMPAAFAVGKKKPGRREFWRARYVATDQGLAIEKFARDGSGLITSLTAADALIEVAEDVTEIREGQMVDVLPLAQFGIAPALGQHTA